MTENPTPTPAPAPQPAPEPNPAAKRLEESRVIIRPWPKVVFFYPVFLCATIFWLVSMFSEEGSEHGLAGLGATFMIVFTVNLLVFAFDFSRIKSITILILGVAIVLALLLANENWPVIGTIGAWFDHVDIRMTTQFYGFFSALFAIVFLIVLINTRFNYYEINHREVLHHHGYLGDVKRTPTEGLRVNKEIYDLLEFVLLRSGRMIFYPGGSQDAIVIDNVINVNAAEERIQDILSVMAVRMQQY